MAAGLPGEMPGPSGQRFIRIGTILLILALAACQRQAAPGTEATPASLPTATTTGTSPGIETVQILTAQASANGMLQVLFLFEGSRGAEYDLQIGSSRFTCTSDSTDPQLYLCEGPPFSLGKVDLILFERGGDSPVYQTTLEIHSLPYSTPSP